MSAQTIVFIESNTTGTGRLFALAARRAGYRPLLISADPARYAYAREEELETRVADTQNLAELRALCDQLAAERGLAAIASTSEYFVETAAELARAHGFPANDPIAIRRCRNKLEQRRRLAEHGVAMPRFWAVHSGEEAADAARTLGETVIVKPLLGSGSVGVRACATPEEARAHADALLAITHNERGQPLPREVLVESAIEGPQYSVETFDRTVAGITANFIGAPPCFVEIGHEHPAELDRPAAQSLEELTLRALAALELDVGPAHTELRLTEEGPKVIEVNARLAGGYIPALVKSASGIDLIDATLARARGEAVHLSPQRAGIACLSFFVLDRPSAVVERFDAAAALEDPRVLEAKLYAATGTRLTQRGDFRDRFGHLITFAADRRAARSAAEEARAKVRLQFA